MHCSLTGPEFSGEQTGFRCIFVPSFSVLSPMALSKSAVCPDLMSCAGLGKCGDRGGSHVLVEDLVREESPTPLGDLAGISEPSSMLQSIH